MSSKRFKKSRSGSIVIIIIILFVIIMVLLGSFLKSMTRRSYSSNKLNKVLLAKEFASSVALLACHKLRDNDINDIDSDLRKALRNNSLVKKNIKTDVVNFDKNKLGNLLTNLKNSYSMSLHDLQYDVSWIVNGLDFKPQLPGYSFDKKGIIKIVVDVSYMVPGSTRKLSEQYVFAVDTMITAAFLPVLSRFSFYLNDALGDTYSASHGVDSTKSLERFNTIKTDSYGDLMVSSVCKPWIFDNGPNSIQIGSLDEIFKGPNGLVYVGSSKKDQQPIALGLTRSWTRQTQGNSKASDCGERMHFFREGTGDGLYTREKIADLYLMNWEIGLSADYNQVANNSDYHNIQTWHEFVAGGGYGEKEGLSSLFKFYGAGGSLVSPTVVLGNVNGRSLCASAYKIMPRTPGGSADAGPLPAFSDEQEFILSAGTNNAENDDRDAGDITSVMSLAEQYKKAYGSVLTLNAYNDKRYGSSLLEFPYNRGLMYIATQYAEPHPDGLLGNVDKLTPIIKGSAGEAKYAVPEPYDKIYPGNSLENMKSFINLNKLQLSPVPFDDGISGTSEVNRERLAYYIDMSELESNDTKLFYKKLRSLNLIITKANGKNIFQFSGWLYVNAPKCRKIHLQDTDFDRNCGIILSKGDIYVDAQIKSTNDSKIMQLITMDGNIYLNYTGKSNLGLTALSGTENSNATDKGQVILSGSKNSGLIQLKGSIAMQTFREPKNNDNVRGLSFEYHSPLAIKPSANPDDITPITEDEERGLLMYSMSEEVKLLE